MRTSEILRRALSQVRVDPRPLDHRSYPASLHPRGVTKGETIALLEKEIEYYTEQERDEERQKAEVLAALDRAKLSPKQREAIGEVVELAARGYSARKIGEMLGISEHAAATRLKQAWAARERARGRGRGAK